MSSRPTSIEMNELHRKLDKDGDGKLDHEEVKSFLPDSSRDSFRKADRNKDGKLDRGEFRIYMESRAVRFARLVIPEREWHIRSPGSDQTDGEYEDEFSCWPPPLFMISFTVLMAILFAYHTVEIVEEKGWAVGINGPPPINSVLIYNPYKRYEAWRFFSYSLVHSGWMHIVSNSLMQLFLGILLEMVHKWWRVAIVFVAGVIAGSLATSLVDPGVFLAGASGGVYALITAHIATVIMNWKEMAAPWVQIVCFIAFVTIDVGTALYYRYVAEVDTKIGYAAHFGGALAGLLVGISVLRNLKRSRWEDKLRWIMLISTGLLFLFAVFWNIFYHSHFPEPRY